MINRNGLFVTFAVFVTLTLIRGGLALAQTSAGSYLKVDSIEVVSAAARGDESQTAPPAQSKEDDVQTVSVTITDNGFEPGSFQLKKGVPARVTFLRKSEVSCAKEVVIPAYHIRHALPLNEPVVVEFTPDKSGEFGFACGMGMLHGKLVVQ